MLNRRRMMLHMHRKQQQHMHRMTLHKRHKPPHMLRHMLQHKHHKRRTHHILQHSTDM
jgi:hypothetical protein